MTSRKRGETPGIEGGGDAPASRHVGGVRAALDVLGRLLLFTALFVAGLIGGTGVLVFAGVPQLAAGSIAMAASALAAGAIMMRRVEQRPAGALGIAWTSASPRELRVGLAIGVGAIAAVSLALIAVGLVRYAGEDGGALDWAIAVAATFGVLAVPAFAEEALFRGYPFQLLAQRAGAVVAVVAGSIVFAAAHGGNPNVDAIALANIFMAGVLLSVAYLRTRSLWFATALHLGWNWGMASLFDLPVSGLELFDTPVYEPVIGGPAWLTGAVFGPEGGLAGTAGFALALVAVLRWPRLEPSPELTALAPLPDG